MTVVPGIGQVRAGSERPVGCMIELRGAYGETPFGQTQASLTLRALPKT